MVRKIGRSAVTGKFEPVATAQRDKRTAVVETIKSQPKPKPPSTKKK